MTKFVLLLIVALATNACGAFGDSYQMEKARFMLVNDSTTDVIFVVNSIEFLVPHGDSPEVIVKIPIPDNPYNPNGPSGGQSSKDKTTNVPVGVKDPRTNNFLATGNCYNAGAKERSIVKYEARFSRVGCNY